MLKLLKLFPREMESNNTKRLSQYTNMFVDQLGPCLNTIHSYFHCYSLAKRNNGCHCFQLTTTAHPRYLGRTLLTFIVLLLQINVTFCYMKILLLFQTLTNNFLALSCLILLYLALFLSILVYPGISWSISIYLGLSWTILDYL